MHRTMLDKSQVTELAAIFFRRLRRMQCYLMINSQIRDCRACEDGGELRKRRKSNARVESGSNKISAHRDYLLC